MRISPAAVAREARRSRNPLYTTHRDVLEEIAVAEEPLPEPRNSATRVQEVEAANRALRGEVKRVLKEQRQLATENLGLLHRVHVAEARLAVRRAR